MLPTMMMLPGFGLVDSSLPIRIPGPSELKRKIIVAVYGKLPNLKQESFCDPVHQLFWMYQVPDGTSPGRPPLPNEMPLVWQSQNLLPSIVMLLPPLDQMHSKWSPLPG